MDTKARLIQYTTVPGFFLQGDPDTDASKFDYTALNFGLINCQYDTDTERDPDCKKTQWQRFTYQVAHLNKRSAQNVRYKLLYLGRHGHGVHNAAEEYYGTKAWDDTFSKREGGGRIIWADAHLNSKGEEQARTANHFWASMITLQHIPTPDKYYVSPLDRCLSTAKLTFSDLTLPADKPFLPVVKELLRETNGVHTCDRRSSKTYIESHYPTYAVEPGFSEEDELWSACHRESDEEQDIRLTKLLDDIFTHDNSTYISLTSHSGSIAAILRVLGHREFRLKTGSAMPVLVRAEIISAATISPSNNAGESSEQR